MLYSLGIANPHDPSICDPLKTDALNINSSVSVALRIFTFIYTAYSIAKQMFSCIALGHYLVTRGVLIRKFWFLPIPIIIYQNLPITDHQSDINFTLICHAVLEN